MTIAEPPPSTAGGSPRMTTRADADDDRTLAADDDRGCGGWPSEAPAEPSEPSEPSESAVGALDAGRDRAGHDAGLPAVAGPRVGRLAHRPQAADLHKNGPSLHRVAS